MTDCHPGPRPSPTKPMPAAVCMAFVVSSALHSRRRLIRGLCLNFKTITMSINPCLRPLGPAFAAMLVACATVDGDYFEPAIHNLKRPFTHGELVISGWESPPIRDGQLVPETRLLIATSPAAKPAFVRLSQGQTYRGMRLSQVDGRADTLGEPSGGLAAVITTDISLELKPGNPKRYLILRDIGADTAAFYSDTPHPPIR